MLLGVFGREDFVKEQFVVGKLTESQVKTKFTCSVAHRLIKRTKVGYVMHYFAVLHVCVCVCVCVCGKNDDDDAGIANYPFIIGGKRSKCVAFFLSSRAGLSLFFASKTVSFTTKLCKIKARDVVMMLLLCSLFFVEIVLGAKLINCPSGQSRLIKVIGSRPSHIYSTLLLFREPHQNPVTLQCVSKCLENEECLGFLLYYNASSCYWYSNEVRPFEDHQSDILDTNVAWFVKTCLNAPNCRKNWIFEHVSGATLVVNGILTLPNLVSRRECQQTCLDQTKFACKSAKFRVIDSRQHLGKCSLNDMDRHQMPNSYRASRSDEEYFENQCSGAATNDFCSFEEYENATLMHADAVYFDKTKEDCEKLCNQMSAFNCRGYTLISTPDDHRSAAQAEYTCLIHSEDTKIQGPKLLVEQEAKYYEKAPCVNVSVTCSDAYMIIRYQPNTDFFGRIYMQGYSENPECYATGKNRNTVTLRVPLTNNHCGISEARNTLNRTLLSTTMILQYNALVQTQADRVIRVGCIFGNNTKVLVGTGVNFTQNYASAGTTLINTTSGLPTVQMRVVDLYSQAEVSDSQIGQELQLVIEVKPPNGPFDIWAGHLVAMTEDGQDSILLLDDRGCPTNLNIFPALTKISDSTTKRLFATFQAFKFSSSAVVRFSVIVQFCNNECPKVDCGSYVDNRVKRSDSSKSIQTTNGTTVVNLNRKEFDLGGKDVLHEMPLEFVLTVRNPKISSDKLVYGENNRILVAGYDYYSNEICIDYALFVGLIITWVLIQLIFVLSGVCLIRRYKRYYENRCVQESLEELHKNFGLGFSNLDNRRVRFADNTALT